MKRYFKHYLSKVFYSFDFDKNIVEKFSLFHGYAKKENTVFNLDCLSMPWFIDHYTEISEIEFNSIFEL